MKSEWKRVIAHVDMDAFFAAIEVLRNPDLAGKPVIIGADPQGGKGRGVVSTASYEARKFGVHSAMPISKAYRLCPEGIFVHPDGNYYGEYSRKVIGVLEQFTPLIQKVSVDEAFLDITGSIHLFGGIRVLAQAIKDRMFDETGLRASIGVAPSKSVAKIASDFDKPDGLTIVPPDQVQDFLDALPVARIWGVGKKTYQQLSEMGIETILQLRNYPDDLLEKRFGKMGPHLHRMSRGIDERAVHLGEEIKSVSHETTFEFDQTDEELLFSTIMELCEKVSIRLRKYRLIGKTVQLKIRLEDFSTFNRNHTVNQATNMTADIYEISCQLFRHFDRKGRPVRLIGVGLSQLISESGSQGSLWDMENQKKADLERVMDRLQDRFGRNALTHAQTLSARKHRADRRKKRKS